MEMKKKMKKKSSEPADLRGEIRRARDGDQGQGKSAEADCMAGITAGG